MTRGILGLVRGVQIDVWIVRFIGIIMYDGQRDEIAVEATEIWIAKFIARANT